MTYLGLPERVESAAARLAGEERTRSERVVALARSIEQRPRPAGKPETAETDDQLRRELSRLVELLSRGSAKAVAAAKLGRALLADLSGDGRAAQQALSECDAQLSMLGL